MKTKKFDLKQIIKEEIVKILNESFESDVNSYVKGNYSELYYFGGYEYPDRRSTNFPTDSTTAIDITPPEKNKVWKNYIHADLNKTLNLPPKKVIFIPMGVISDVGNISKNINNLLKPKGVVIINEYVSFSKDLIKTLITKYNFKILSEHVQGQINPEYAEEDEEYEIEGIYDNIILQKP
jgi:hypothetical protein